MGMCGIYGGIIYKGIIICVIVFTAACLPLRIAVYMSMCTRILSELANLFVRVTSHGKRHTTPEAESRRRERSTGQLLLSV